MGFPGYKDQSALCFLTGRSSRFSSIIAVCSETAMSRQDNFFSFKVFVHILAVYVGMQWISIFPLFLLCYGDIFLDILLVRFLFILCCT